MRRLMGGFLLLIAACSPTRSMNTGEMNRSYMVDSLDPEMDLHWGLTTSAPPPVRAKPPIKPTEEKSDTDVAIGK